MSFNINSDKEFISGQTSVYWYTQFSIRNGTGVDQKEVIRHFWTQKKTSTCWYQQNGAASQ